MPLERKPDGIRTGPLSGQSKDALAGKRTRRVVFIPWDRDEGAEWNTKTDQWNRVKGGRFEIINYDPGITRQPVLVAISDQRDAAIYLRGHGNPGNPYIQARSQNTDRFVNLPIEVACQRLIESGLQPTFPGVIKFYSCHSGTKLVRRALEEEQRRLQGKQKDILSAFQQKIISAEQRDLFLAQTPPAPEDKSMARQGADYLRGKGFTRCIFYGYLGPLAATYEEDDGDPFKGHKKVELTGLQKPPAHLKGVNTTRPSAARVRV